MPARKKRWGKGSLEYQASELGERIYEAMGAAEGAYWRAFKKFFPEIGKSEDPSMYLELNDGPIKAVFTWLKEHHPDVELVAYLETIFGRESTPEERAAWMEKLKRWGMT